MTFRRVEVRPKPGSSRLISSWRDAFHVKDNRASLLFDSCYVEKIAGGASIFQRTGCTSCRSSRALASRSISLTTRHCQGPGDSLEIANSSTGAVLGEVKVTAADAAQSALDIAGPVPGLSVGALVISLDASNRGTIVRNSTVIGTGMRLRSTLTLENIRSEGGTVLVSSERDVEGPVPRIWSSAATPSITSSTYWCCRSELIGGATSQRSIKNIRKIVENTFKHVAQIPNTEGVVFKNDEFATDWPYTLLDLDNDAHFHIGGMKVMGAAIADPLPKLGIGTHMTLDRRNRQSLAPFRALAFFGSEHRCVGAAPVVIQC